LSQQVNILVVDVHRAWTLAIDVQRIFLLNFGPGTGAFPWSSLRIRRTAGDGHATGWNLEMNEKTSNASIAGT
ncbi:MAG: hypothetical protein ACK53L_12135, partial [Pirellulaceae bacterium]